MNIVNDTFYIDKESQKFIDRKDVSYVFQIKEDEYPFRKNLHIPISGLIKSFTSSVQVNF